MKRLDKIMDKKELKQVIDFVCRNYGVDWKLTESNGKKYYEDFKESLFYEISERCFL